jgi:hypothetical protein
MIAFLAEPSPVPVLVMLKSNNAYLLGPWTKNSPKRAGGRPRKRPIERPLETSKGAGPGWENRRLYWRAANGRFRGILAHPSAAAADVTTPLNGDEYKTATFNPKE